MMGIIERLPVSVVNKIAAGEVIERPASLVKELMENAVDAEAQRIDVAIEKGGSQLVRVTDTGSGIEADQLTLAIAAHATSKLRRAEDLFCVSTLGFRGEALASIAAVSHMVIRSRPRGSDTGSQIEAIGGAEQGVVPCGCGPGTSVEIRNLYFNTPVRRKFLRTPQTEMSHCTEAFTRLALAHPQVHFTLSHNGRELYDLAPTNDWRQRIARFFGDDLAEALIAVDSCDGPIGLSGYVARPSHSRANNRLQYLLLNGRAIRDRSLQHALAEAYRGLLLPGRYPICFLHLRLPADAVDVNVHPTKAEVRFLDAQRMYSHLLGSLRSRFLTTDLTARFSPSGAGAEPVAGRPAAGTPEPARWVQADLAQPASPDRPESAGPLPRPADRPATTARRPLLSGMAPAPSGRHPADDLPASDQPPPWKSSAADRAPLSAPPPPALQIHNRYLVTENEEGVVVIDQHALHERILYEQLREKVLRGNVEAQNLLVPEPVDLSPREAAAVIGQRELLARLGMEIKPFGGDTVLVCSYPAMLTNMRPAEVLRGLVEHLLAGGKAPDAGDLLDNLLQMIACKAAIKAGDRLTPDEIAALLQQRRFARDSHHCPHGRPTALVFTREDLDRQFKRT